jgi:hypothetical protein
MHFLDILTVRNSADSARVIEEPRTLYRAVSPHHKGVVILQRPVHKRLLNGQDCATGTGRSVGRNLGPAACTPRTTPTKGAETWPPTRLLVYPARLHVYVAWLRTDPSGACKQLERAVPDVIGDASGEARAACPKSVD